MKILIANDCYAAPYYIRLGQGKALNAAGHEVVVWDIHQKSAFDAFNEFEPDLFMGQTYNIDRAVSKCIAARPNMKVVLFSSAWGELANSIDKKEFPIDYVTDKEKSIIEKLKKETGKPDVVHIHCPDRYVDGVLGGWREIGVEPIGLMNGADIFSYSGGKVRPEYRCDVGYVGGFWGYKSRNIKPILLPLCHPDSGISVKIFGNSHWNVHNYLGPIKEEDVKNLFASASVCPNISEPHSLAYGYDIVERVFKIPLSGFLVSDHVAGIASDVFTDGECPIFKSYENLMALAEYYSLEENQGHRQERMDRQKKVILGGHTYFHRMAKMMRAIGLPKQEKVLLDKYNEIITPRSS